MKSNFKRVRGIFVVLAVIATAFFVWDQRWYIHDEIRLRGYVPPAEISQLADDITLNKDSKRLFYVYHPALNEKQEFNNNCKFGEKTIILGCYVSGKGIYVFKVTDARLNGIVQVTAAHETLHAAYDRLSTDEKSHINQLTQDVYKSLNNPRINESISEYQKNGADTDNELHSIIGTEVRQLPPELEKYYSRYFSNRLKIVEYSEKYEQAFTERKQKVAEYDKTLGDLKAQIDKKDSEVESTNNSLKAERERLDSLLSAKDYEAYNSAVPKYNSSVNSYNKVVKDVRALIDEYNGILVQRNSIVSEEAELLNAIDSRPLTLPTQ